MHCLVGLITGHVFVNRHLKLVGVKDSPLYPLCSEDRRRRCTFWVNVRLLLPYGNAS